MPTNHFNWNLENSYLSLPKKFYRNQEPTPVSSPCLVLWNHDLAMELELISGDDIHLDKNEIDSIDSSNSMDDTNIQYLEEIFSGNKLLENSEPIAQSYAGHQFGHFTMLGDGRAILLGEQVTTKQERYDIQLKGAGITPFSRGGDGRATFYSMLREYLMSEALHNLRIPTTRSLAVVTTGDKVYREEVQAGAILTRVASSHIRVGTFEFAYHFLSEDEIEKLTHYAIQRHYQNANQSENQVLTFFQSVMERQLDLILHWMRVGFIHGVMNTDNMSISGETIDYGPCAFMNTYDPKTVFSSIDRQGRYAFGNQPAIAQWNLACLANSILPLIDSDSSKAIELARGVLDQFADLFDTKYWNMMGLKIGIDNLGEPDRILVENLRIWMETNHADYTNTFLALEQDDYESDSLYLHKDFQAWKIGWKNRLQELGLDWKIVQSRLKENNPSVIPRNHKVEEALLAASKDNDMKPFHEILKVLANPYSRENRKTSYHDPNLKGDKNYKTFCGT